MKTITYLTSSVILAVSLTACGPMNKQDVGTITGGALGGLIGSQFGSGAGQALAVAGGVLAGAVIGGKIGEYMDRQDRIIAMHALETTPTGSTKRWSNPDNGKKYAVTPTRTYYETHQGQAQPCREYRTTAWIAGKKESMYGRACREADGSWKAIT